MLDAILDALIDSVKLVPFLFVTYIIIGLVERKASEKNLQTIANAEKFGPLWGALLGVVPQCGFSAMASTLYAARIISVGTLIAIYLSTSDEMLPLFIAASVPAVTIIKILAVKIAIGMFWGFVLEFVFRKGFMVSAEPLEIEEADDEEYDGEIVIEGCDCKEQPLVMYALSHTLQIFGYIIVFSIVINLLIAVIGEDSLALVFTDIPFLGEVIAGIVGLIPNCASSVVITELYIEGVLSPGAMMAGLLVNAGVGLVVLFRENTSHKESGAILAVLYATGVISGFLVNITGIAF